MVINNLYAGVSWDMKIISRGPQRLKGWEMLVCVKTLTEENPFLQPLAIKWFGLVWFGFMAYQPL